MIYIAGVYCQTGVIIRVCYNDRGSHRQTFGADEVHIKLQQQLTGFNLVAGFLPVRCAAGRSKMCFFIAQWNFVIIFVGCSLHAGCGNGAGAGHAIKNTSAKRTSHL